MTRAHVQRTFRKIAGLERGSAIHWNGLRDVRAVRRDGRCRIVARARRKTPRYSITLAAAATWKAALDQATAALGGAS